MSKSTPGPWRWSFAGFSGLWSEGMKEKPHGNFEALIGPNGEIVGCAQDASSYAASFDASNEDKLLMEAAPDLLHALQCLLDKCDQEWGVKGIWPQTRNDAMAAIAKAKGK